MFRAPHEKSSKIYLKHRFCKSYFYNFKAKTPLLNNKNTTKYLHLTKFII